MLCHEIGIYFTLKEASIGPPKIYLGGHVWTVQLDNGVTCSAFGSLQYVQAAVKTVETYLKDHCSRGDVMYSSPAWDEPPIQTDYCPELDILPDLDSNDSAYFQSLIGILCWIIELRRVDICLEVSMMSSHLALPFMGYLKHVFSFFFASLKKYHNAELVFLPY